MWSFIFDLSHRLKWTRFVHEDYIVPLTFPSSWHMTNVSIISTPPASFFLLIYNGPTPRSVGTWKRRIDLGKKISLTFSGKNLYDFVVSFLHSTKLNHVVLKMPAPYRIHFIYIDFVIWIRERRFAWTHHSSDGRTCPPKNPPVIYFDDELMKSELRSRANTRRHHGTSAAHYTWLYTTDKREVRFIP